jgi:hypothetical protein
MPSRDAPAPTASGSFDFVFMKPPMNTDKHGFPDFINELLPNIIHNKIHSRPGLRPGPSHFLSPDAFRVAPSGSTLRSGASGLASLAAGRLHFAASLQGPAKRIPGKR